LIKEDRSLRVFYVPYKEIGNYVDQRKSESFVIPEDVDKVRLVTVKDLSTDICYGTVLRSTREIGSIRIIPKHNRYFEEKAGGNKRLAFVVS